MSGGDLVVTWPKSRTLSSYLSELTRAEEAGLEINFRVANAPRIGFGDWRGRPGRCYIVHDGAIRGYNEIRYIIDRAEGEVIDPVTGRAWPAGNYIVRDPAWHRIDPIPMRGFRGFRYFEGAV